MGVDRTDYIVYGWKLPYKLKTSNGRKIDLWSEYQSMLEGHKDEKFSIISDGMCGDYNVFGVVLNSGGDEWEGWDFVDLKFNVDDSLELKSKYKEIFEMGEDEIVSEPHLFIFSHFS